MKLILETTYLLCWDRFPEKTPDSFLLLQADSRSPGWRWRRRREGRSRWRRSRNIPVVIKSGRGAGRHHHGNGHLPLLEGEALALVALEDAVHDMHPYGWGEEEPLGGGSPERWADVAEMKTAHRVYEAGVGWIKYEEKKGL